MKKELIKKLSAMSYDETMKCEWCDDEFELSELYATSCGILCEYCIEAIKSRGERIVIYGRADEVSL